MRRSIELMLPAGSYEALMALVLFTVYVKPAEKAEKGDVFTLAISEKIRPSDKLYKLVTEIATVSKTSVVSV